MNISNALSKSVGMWDERHKRIGDLSGTKTTHLFSTNFATDPDLFVPR